MEVFEKEIKISDEHLDERQHVNNVVYLGWVQEISREHWLLRASKEAVEKYYWVVKTHKIDNKKQVFLNDVLIAKTFVNGYKGPFWSDYAPCQCCKRSNL